MPDTTYGPKTYTKDGGDTEVIASGGKQTIESGGEVDFEDGAKLTLPMVVKAADFTALAAESGATFLIGAADVKATLPPTEAGLRYTFIVKTLPAGTGCQIDPAAADAIHGAGLTSVDDKDLINTAATDAEGDSVTLIGDGVDGWWIESINGTWAKE